MDAMSDRGSDRSAVARRSRQLATLLVVLLPVLTFALVLGMVGTGLVPSIPRVVSSATATPTSPTRRLRRASRPRSTSTPRRSTNSVHGKQQVLQLPQGIRADHPAAPPRTRARTTRQVAIEACEGCHQKEFMQYQTSSHAKLFYQDEAGPICISCHGSHEIRKVSLGEETADFKMSMARDSCGRCHKDKFEKATPRVPLQGPLARLRTGGDLLRLPRVPRQPRLEVGSKSRLSNSASSVIPGATAGFTYFQMHLDEGFQNAWWGVRVVYLFFSDPADRRARHRHRVHDGPPPERDSHHPGRGGPGPRAVSSASSARWRRRSVRDKISDESTAGRTKATPPAGAAKTDDDTRGPRGGSVDGRPTHGHQERASTTTSASTSTIGSATS